MVPAFCTFPADLAPNDPYFTAVAATFGLGSRRPGLIVRVDQDHLEVLIAPDGLTTSLPAAAVRRGLADDAALGMMDAVEEAIEDALASGESAERIAALERTLALLERCLDDEIGAV